MAEEDLKTNQETIKYFDSKFEHMQYQINEIKDNQKSMMVDINKRFEKIDERFEDMQSKNDERFKQTDERFKQIDERLSSIDLKIEQLITSQQTSVRDYIIERDRFYDKKFNNLRMLNIATISIVAGIFLKMTGVITI